VTSTLPESHAAGWSPKEQDSTARILERGYRHYTGPRNNVGGSIRSVFKHTVRACLGLGRPARSKVFPILTIVLAYVPTLVYIGVIVIGNRLQVRNIAARFVSDYANLYQSVVLAVILFAAFVAPEVLCPDRRNGMLGLYLSSPLRRSTYLLAKGLAVLAMVSIVTIGPPLILLIGYSTQGFGPPGLGQWFLTLGRIVGAGLIVAIMYTIVSLAISSITSRKAAASAAFLAMIVGLPALVTFLVLNANINNNYRLLDLATLPYEAVTRVFNTFSSFDVIGGELSATSIWLACGGWVAVSVAVIANRYRRVQVTK
jgi:ABC-2 type transport system permease protein